MIDINTILYILIAHYVADFSFQSNWVGSKLGYKSIYFHTALYTVIFWIVLIITPLRHVNGTDLLFWFAVINGLLHFSIDYISDLVLKHTNKPIYKTIAVGLDQLAHYTCLFLTYHYITTNI